MANATTKQILNASITYEDKPDRLAGQLALENGMLSVVSAESEKDREYLDDVVENLNATKFLVDLAPPANDAPRYSVGAEEYDREHPEFENVLKRKLLENHSVKVEPAQ